MLEVLGETLADIYIHPLRTDMTEAWRLPLRLTGQLRSPEGPNRNLSQGQRHSTRTRLSGAAQMKFHLMRTEAWSVTANRGEKALSLGR